MHLDLHIHKACSLQQRCQCARRVQVALALPVRRRPPLPCAPRHTGLLCARSRMMICTRMPWRTACCLRWQPDPSAVPAGINSRQSSNPGLGSEP